MAGWEMVLVGIGLVLLTLFLWPGLKEALKRSQEAEKDWGALVVPIGAVIVFVIVLLWLA